MNPVIMTFKGGYFNFLDPQEDQINIRDVAHALSNTCRFGGHCREFYSVAQHAVLVSKLVDVTNIELQWDALHHDDGEAYMGDVPTPLKQLLPDFKKIEDGVELAIVKKFKLTNKYAGEVKVADLQALMLERDALLPDDRDGFEWTCFRGVPRPDYYKIVPLAPKEAEHLFLDRFYELKDLLALVNK